MIDIDIDIYIYIYMYLFIYLPWPRRPLPAATIGAPAARRAQSWLQHATLLPLNGRRSSQKRLETAGERLPPRHRGRRRPETAVRDPLF